MTPSDSSTDAPRIDQTGDAIRQARNSKGISLSELARRLDWHKSKLSRYETSETPVGADDIVAIAEALEIQPEELLFECLQIRFPSLRDTDSELGRMVSGIIEYLKELRRSGLKR